MSPSILGFSRVRAETSMGRGNQIARHWQIIRWLERSKPGVTIADLSRELNCSPRTIYRDLEDLQRAGFPLCEERVDGTIYWQFVEGYRVSLPTPFSMLELMSLYLSRDLLQALRGTFFYESIQNLIGKIRAQLGPELTRFLESTEASFAAGNRAAADYGKHRELLHLLNEACLQRETVRFVYHSRKEERTTRTVDPYKVYYFDGTLYLIGHDHLRAAERMFVIDRMRLLEKTGAHFAMEKAFDLQGFLRHSFGVMREDLVQVRVRLDRAVARFVAEKQWHSSQGVTQNPDGSMDFSFQVAGTLEIKQWILGLGPAARVLEPAELREELVADLRKTLGNYSEIEKKPARRQGAPLRAG